MPHERFIEKERFFLQIDLRVALPMMYLILRIDCLHMKKKT
jgi:hypothetical protein